MANEKKKKPQFIFHDKIDILFIEFTPRTDLSRLTLDTIVICCRINSNEISQDKNDANENDKTTIEKCILFLAYFKAIF